MAVSGCKARSWSASCRSCDSETRIDQITGDRLGAAATNVENAAEWPHQREEPINPIFFDKSSATAIGVPLAGVTLVESDDTV